MFLRLFVTFLLFVLLTEVLIGALMLQRAESHQLSGLLSDFLIAAGLGAVLATVPAFILARRFVQPVHSLTDGAQRIAEGDYDFKIYVGGASEYQALARTFNEMSEELATQFAQLEQDRQQLRAILDGMVEGVVAMDREQCLLFVNDRAADLLGFRPEEAIGRKFWEVVRHRKVQQVLQRAHHTAEPHREEIDWVGANVKNIAIYAAELPGNPSHGTIMVLHDTTQLRQLERLRQDFVANVTHELNTPLSVIKSAVEVLFAGAMDDPDSRMPFLEQISSQADRLHALISDLLSLARIESNKLDLQIMPEYISLPIEDAIERLSMRAEAKSQRLFAIPPEIDDLQVWIDDSAIAQILDNLIDNAIKYTPAGGSIQVRWYAPDESHVCMEIEDTGIGIPEQDLPRIFERFYRVDKGRSRDIGGTGLGLAIVKHLVQALQGNIRATSRPGVGTTFTVTLRRVRDE